MKSNYLSGMISTALLALVGNVVAVGQASAYSCGSIEYPDCRDCSRTHIAAEMLPHGIGCEGCGGICYAFDSTKQTQAEYRKVAAAVETANHLGNYGHVTESNFIDADAGKVAEIAQVNPMAALVIDAYSQRNEPRSGNFKRGRVAFSGTPTLKTYQSSTQASSASAPIDTGMLPPSSPKLHAQLSWTSRVLPSGNLEVTYVASEANDDDVEVRTLYPAVKVVLANSKPSKLLSWQLAN